jgi:hypothetical protein
MSTVVAVSPLRYASRDLGGVMTILLIALIKALLTLSVFVAFAVIIEQIMVRARARLSTALYLCSVSLIPMTTVALELSWHSKRPIAALVQLGITVFLILLAVLPPPPELIAQIRRSGGGPTAKVPVVTRLTPHGTHIKSGETLTNLAIIGCLLTAYFAKITDETIPFLTSSVAVIVALTANSVIRRRLKERTGALNGGMDLQLESGWFIHGAKESHLASIEGEDFAILSDGRTFIQCALRYESPDCYILEYQDGSEDRHYRAVDERITFDRVLSGFRKYLRSDESWRTDFRWEKVDLDAELIAQPALKTTT